MSSPIIHDHPPHPLADWIDRFRGEWQERRAKVDPVAGAKRRKAVFTMVHNEKRMLPIWLNYYSKHFGPDDIYVLDHDSDDGSTAGSGFKRIPVSSDEFDNVWQLRQVEQQQRKLLETYDTVLFTDVDEIVVPHPSLGDLTDYMNTFEEPFVTCMGYEIIHLPDREDPFDFDRKVLDQRHYWFENPAYSKAVLVTEPASWEPGFHRRADGHFNVDPDLYMVHLHRLDYDLCLERHVNWSSRRWSKRRLEEGWGSHNGITETEEFRQWYFESSGFKTYPALIHEIPDVWKGAF